MLDCLLANGFGRVIGQKRFTSFPLFAFDEARLKEFDESGFNDYKNNMKEFILSYMKTKSS